MRLSLFLLLVLVFSAPTRVEASVSVGSITITELVNNCTQVGVFQSADVLELKVPITNDGPMGLFRVLVRMRATNASNETVDANYTGPLYVHSLPSSMGFDDSFGLVFNTPLIPTGGTYTVTARLGLHNQFLGAIGIANNGSGTIHVDVEVYLHNMSGVSGFMGSSSTSITVYRRNPCGNSTSGTIVTDRAVYDNVGDVVTIEWGAAGCDARPAFAEQSPATVEIRRMSGLPSGDPVADFAAATPVTSISTWNVNDMPDDGCTVDEGVGRTFCYNDQIGTVQSVSLYNTYVTQTADMNKYLIIRLPQGAGTASHPIREHQFNYFYVGNPVPIELESFHGRAQGGRVHLTWTTATEQDNLGFLIYRAGEDQDYQRLVHDLIPGAGTSLVPRTYGYVDETVRLGATYRYLLSDVSTSGEERFHGPVVVTVPGVDVTLTIPNPLRHGSALAFTVPQAQRVSVALYDVGGRLRAVLADEQFGAGTHRIVVDRGVAPAGAYVLRVTTPTGTISSPLSVAP